jgi:hypothetical protein
VAAARTKSAQDEVGQGKSALTARAASERIVEPDRRVNRERSGRAKAGAEVNAETAYDMPVGRNPRTE